MRKEKPNNNLTKIILLFLFIFAILIWQSAFWQTDHNLHINILNVGQGDAIHLRYEDIDVLVDGGPDRSVLTELGKNMPYYDRNIEHVFLTHADADHVTGLVDVLKNYNIGKVYLTGSVKDTAVFDEFIKIIEEKNIPIQFVKTDDIIDFSEDYNFEIFWPLEKYVASDPGNANNTSIVGEVRYKNVEILLTGDAETDIQSHIIELAGNKLKTDILKVAHHGAKNGTNSALLEVVNPELACISVGSDNRFGHPHQETLDLLEQFDIRTFRTDIDGTISIISDGINYWTK